MHFNYLTVEESYSQTKIQLSSQKKPEIKTFSVSEGFHSIKRADIPVPQQSITFLHLQELDLFLKAEGIQQHLSSRPQNLTVFK